MKKFMAFTLAETLIVMGIIGVVAALTLPNLNSTTGEKEKVARVKKIYSNLSDAYERAVAIYGPIDEWFKTDNTSTLQATRFGERMTEFMKTSKNCGVAVNKGCFSSGKVYTLNNTVYDENTNDSYSHMYKIITADGMSVAFYATSNYIHVDIDGPNKGKNKMGDDRFTFFIDGMIKKDLVLKPLAIESTRTGAFNKNYDVYIWAIENDNMDYLKCADKLNWQNQTTCK